ncbi:MAG TPA: efflux RND transporter permease subunit [Xenococcaceae cyanobacterium]
MWKWLYSNIRLSILIICLILAWGLSSFNILPRMEDPNLSHRGAFITTSFPGASTPRVESLVTEKIEQELFQIAEVKTINSISRLGSSVVFVELQESVTDVAEIWSQVRDRINDVIPQLPEGVEEPEFEEFETRAYTLITSLVWNLEQAPNYALLSRLSQELEDKLRTTGGTEKVTVYGIPQEEVVVEVDAADLMGMGLTAQEIAQQIEASDAKVAAGQMYNSNNELLIEVETELDSLARIRQIPVSMGDRGQFSRLGDFASVTKGMIEPASEIALIDGKPAVVLATLMQPDWRIDRWAESTRQSLADFQQRLPPGIDLEMIFDQSVYVETRLGQLFDNLVLGAFWVFICTILLMGWRSALIVGLALPLSVLMVFGGMRVLEVPLHQMSVTGLVIALGLLIDNAVVVVDEVQTELKRGIKPQAAISHSLNRLAIPLLASTLTTVLSFMPIVLMPGNSGEFVRGVALSVILALLSSLFLSLTIIPALAGRIHKSSMPAVNDSLTGKTAKEPNSWWHNGISFPWLTAIYRRTLEGIFTRPVLGIILALLMPALGFMMAGTLQEQFFPPAERDQINLELELPPQASLAQTRDQALAVRDRLLQYPEITAVSWFIGKDAPAFYYNLQRDREDLPNYAQAIVQLDSATHSQELISTLQNELDRDFPQSRILVKQLEQGPTVLAPIELHLYGADVAMLQELGDRVRSELAQIPEVTHTNSTLTASLPKLGLKLDEEQARLAGLDPSEVARQLDAMLQGYIGGSIVEDTEELPVRVRLADLQRGNLDRIASLNLLATPTAEARTAVPLSSLVEIKLVPELFAISRRNGQRVNTVRGYLSAGVLPGTVLDKVKENLAASNFQLPSGYSLDWGGEAAERDNAVGGLMSTVGVLLVLMLAILVLSFGSFRSAGIIALVGVSSVGLGLASLWLFDSPLGFMAVLGIIGLIGVAINDSIVVLAALRAHPTANQGNIEAMATVVVNATRHVLTTTITTIAGFIPLLLYSGGFWRSLSVCLVGGVGGATLLALYFVPCAYLLVTQKYSYPYLKGDHLGLHWALYASGSFGLWLLVNILSTLLIYRYDPSVPNSSTPFLLSSAFVGISQLVGRTVGAFAQPAMGYFSDLFDSQWGKRRPFLALGTFPLVICFILLFMPPLGLGSLGNIAYLSILLCVFYLALAVYYIPYLAWLPTIALNSQQQVTVSTLMAVSSLLGTAVGGVCAPLLADRLGFELMAAIAGSLGAIALLLPLAIPESLKPIKAQSFSLLNSWKTVVQNSALRSHFISISLDWIGITILTTCITYAAVALFQKDVSFGGTVYGVFLGGTAIAFPLVIVLAKRLGKNFALKIAMAWTGLGLILLGLWSLFFSNYLSAWLLLLFVSSFGWAGFFVLPNTILPDLISKQVEPGDTPKEAVYFGIRGLLIEISIGIGALTAGLILTLGKTAAQPLGVQLSFLIAGVVTLISSMTLLKSKVFR